MRWSVRSVGLFALAAVGSLHACDGEPDDQPEADLGCSLLDSDGALRSFTELWPCLTPGVRSLGVSSYDRTGGNDDGFNGTWSSLYTDPHGHFVVVDVAGPGRLNTLWFTTASGGLPPLGLGEIRFYFDGEAEPRIAVDADELFRGTTAPFLAPLVADNHTSTGGFASWVPMPFARRLVITTERKAAFYSAQYDLLPADLGLESWTAAVTSAPLFRAFTTADDPLVADPAAVEVTLEHTWLGTGVVERLRLTPSEVPSDVSLRAARIRIWWDGEAEPSVDCPLPDFFGSGLGYAPVAALPFRMTATGYENRFPMPFWEGFRISVTGFDGRMELLVGPQRYSRAEAGHLHAMHREEDPTTAGEDFVWLNAAGAGKLVGTVLTVEPRTAGEAQWWEGDLRTRIDAAESVTLHGTGHEDDHLGGWSNEFLDRPFTLPMHGEPRADLLTREGRFNGSATMYRLWPGIPFLSGIRHSIEHGTQNSVETRYRGTVFWYAVGGPRLVQTDAVGAEEGHDDGGVHEIRAPADGRLEELESSYDGNPTATVETRMHLAHLDSTSLRMTIRSDNTGVLLRRVYDAAAPGQRAAVRVDGVEVREWSSAAYNPSQRWGVDEVFLPPAVTAGKSTVRVELDPLGEVPWEWSEISALALVP